MSRSQKNSDSDESELDLHRRKRLNVFGDAIFCPNLINFSLILPQFCPNFALTLPKSNQICLKKIVMGCGCIPSSYDTAWVNYNKN